jgi:hypothetical protein
MGAGPGGRHYITRPEGRQSRRRDAVKKKTLELPAQAIRGIFLGPLTRTVLTTVRLLAPKGRHAFAARKPNSNHVEEESARLTRLCC